MNITITIPVIRGTSGHDRITGTSRSDIIYGDAGDDIIEGGGGADLIYGDAGSDTGSYANSSAAVQINLSGDTQHGGDAEGDQLFSIENVIGSAFDDTITGNSLDNRLEGRGGADALFGGAGNDILIGGLDGKVDTLYGGTGIDTVDYSTGTLGMTITLGSGSTPGAASVNDHLMPFTLASGQVIQIFREGWQEDQLYSIENVVGSRGNDMITGNSAANRLEGGAGNDIICGAGGDDVIIGGRGADELYGDAGRDTFVYTDYRESGITWASNGPILHGEDAIYGFEAGIDKIDLSAIDADPFQSGNQAFHWVEQFTGAPGEIRWFDFARGDVPAWGGGTTAISADIDGDSNADLTIWLLTPASLDYFFLTDVIL